MKTYYAISGRMCGDDEDTAIAYTAERHSDAVAEFIEDMWAMEGCDAETRAMHEANGEGVFINAVLQSDAPIKVL